MPALFKIKSVSNVLVANHDRTAFSTAHPKHLPLLTSPVQGEGEAHEQEKSIHRQGELHHTVPNNTRQYNPPGRHGGSPRTSDEPVLHHSHESSVIQLFFDLFFVANLTAFTSAHEINNPHGMSSKATVSSCLTGMDRDVHKTQLMHHSTWYLYPILLSSLGNMVSSRHFRCSLQ